MNQDSQNHNQPDLTDDGNFHDLPWLAFRYIAGEMQADECRDFEIRLQHDQTAREAVAQSVVDSQLIDRALALSSTPTTEFNYKSVANSTRSAMARPRFAQPIILAALACGLAAVVVFYGLNQLDKNTPIAKATSGTTADNESQMDLAEAWADSDWELTPVAYNSTNQFATNETESDFNLDDSGTEFDSDWIEATLGDIDTKPMSVEN